ENAGNGGLEVAQDSLPFGSIKELLASVPKGPQLKIQRALREAGIGSAESKSSHVSAVVATPNVAAEKEKENMPYSEDRCCVICLERKIE
ncbi:unnamed protein product, partial [Ascophyllum nodosum]